MGALSTCGEPNELQKNTHPEYTAAPLRGQGDVWTLLANNETVQNYTGDDLRWTIVYRARCFKDAATADRYNAQKDTGAASLEHILSVLRGDLVAKGKGTVG